MLLGADSTLDDLGVEGVGDQRDDQVDLLKGLVQSSVIANIKGDRIGVLEALAQLLGTLEGTTGYKPVETMVSIVSNLPYRRRPSVWRGNRVDNSRLGRCRVYLRSIARTDSDVNIRLAQDLDSGLRNYWKSNHEPMYTFRKPGIAG